MIIKLSQKISQIMSLSDIEEECITYGLSIIVHQLLGFIIAVVIGTLFTVVKELFIVIVLFTPLRICAGGYHASRPETCIFYSSIMFTLMSLYLKYMVGINVLLTHSVFILLYIVVALIKVPNPVRNYFTNLEDTTQSTSVKSILIVMLVIYILSFLMNYCSFMQYLSLGLLANTVLMVIDIVQKIEYKNSWGK